MAGQAASQRTASTSTPSTVKSPDSDVSPRAQPSQPASHSVDYFPARGDSNAKINSGTQGGVKFPSLPSTSSRSAQIFDQNSPNFHRGSVASSTSQGTAAESQGELGDQGSSRRVSDATSFGRPGELSRKSSAASVSFRPTQDKTLPQGAQRKTDGQRLRASSPEPIRFKRHVGFDNLHAGEATKDNTSSLTLNVRHQGYHPRRRSRTFMVGVDEHAYSDYALVWLLENLVDDGDEVVCVRVIETPVRGGDKSYLDEAKKMMHGIQEKNTQNRAISIILEYSVGKLHATFQQLIQIYQPSMLIVGTRGRSLGGIQGLVNNRNSFSKYCLQYSPVPVVVVRPDEKRKKKKDKRTHDPSRQSYLSMLSSNEGVHEADKGTGAFETETQIPPEEEAHRVAAALGLPAAFDPTIKPLPVPVTVAPRNPGSSVLDSSVSTTEAPVPPLERRTSTPPPLLATNDDSGEDDSGGDEDEDQFDVVSGQNALKAQREREQLAMQAQKDRLHRMEVGEAAALLKSGNKINEEDEDEEDETSSQGSGGVNRRKST